MIPALTLDKADRILVLAVHPDDETLGTGGLLQQAAKAGLAVRVVFITDGDNNPWPQRALERRWSILADDRARWGRRRRDEAKAALTQLGVDPQQAIFLGLPDQGLSGLLERADTGVLEQLTSLIAAWRPSLLVSSSPDDLHPDHNALAVLLDMALKRLPATLQSPKVLSYAVHRKPGDFPAAEAVKLSDAEFECKRRALLCHETQMALSRRRFMRHVQARESFAGPSPADRFQQFHPVEEVLWDETALHVQVRIGRLQRWLGGFDLFLVALRAQPRAALRIPVNGRSGAVDVLDAANGAIVGQAVIRARNCMVRMRIPRALLSGAEEVSLKLKRRRGFLDYAGWRRARTHTRDPRRAVDTVGIIPCYNVQDFCADVILNTLQFVDHVILIDDGSRDGTAEILGRLARAMPERISLIRFPYNRGKGVGLMAGFCEALNRFDFKALVTLDADGQHPPARIPALTEAIAAGAEMVIGERQIAKMPGRSKFGNAVISAALHLFYAQAPVDTQSGMRAFSQPFAEEIARRVQGSRYETEFQVLLLALAQQRALATVPIPTIYIDNNKSSKFRPVIDSLSILGTLVRWRFDRCLNGRKEVHR